MRIVIEVLIDDRQLSKKQAEDAAKYVEFHLAGVLQQGWDTRMHSVDFEIVTSVEED